MSILSRVVTRSARRALRVMLHGPPGVGKTTWAAQAPGALILTPSSEDGMGELEVPRLVVSSWREAEQAVEALIEAKGGGYSTMVVDTMSSMEALGYAEVCRGLDVASIEDARYGRGYTAALELHQRLQGKLEALRGQGINIILLCQSRVKAVQDPLGSPYDRVEPALHEKVSQLWTAWADVVALAWVDVEVRKQGGRREAADPFKKGRAVDAARRLRLDAGPAGVAKSRLYLPENLPLEWPAFAEAAKWDSHRQPVRPPAPAPAPKVPARAPKVPAPAPEVAAPASAASAATQPPAPAEGAVGTPAHAAALEAARRELEGLLRPHGRMRADWREVLDQPSPLATRGLAVLPAPYIDVWTTKLRGLSAAELVERAAPLLEEVYHG